MRKSRKDQEPVVFGMGTGEEAYYEQLAKSQVRTLTGEDTSTPTESQALAKSILNVLDGQDGIHRLSFDTDPRVANNYAGIYRPKVRLVPDTILKRIAIQDSLVASIARTRQNHMSQFGRPRQDRFGKGFIIKPDTGTLDSLNEAEKQKFAERVDRAVKLLLTCGHTEGVEGHHQRTFSEYLGLAARSAVVCGRTATEIVWRDDVNGNREFSHFVCVDSGTIYKATTDFTGQEAIRKEAYHLLCKLTGKELTPESKWNEKGEYKWVQVVEGTPTQVFTDQELKVYNFYPVPDVEVDGYPVTPIDTVITAITTHINITTHNKVYFQSGRATRGMLVIKTDNASKQLIHQIKQQFNASINGASSAWRMPVFGVPTSGEINWQPIDAGGGRDMEFQYLTDMNAREIMSAFMMSPDELPGWSYLSRGTASQALSECVAYSSRILSDNGLVSIGDFVGDGKEKKGVFWTGKRWAKGRAFKSGVKSLIETELSCGIKLQTSPDHRFRIVGDDGELAWKHQSELSVGDRVLVNSKPVSGFETAIPSFKGKRLTPEIAEILGWMTGDGCLCAPRKSAQVHLFYHPEKEEQIWNDQFNVLQSFGVNVSHIEKPLSDADKEDIKKKRGFGSVARRRILNTIYDTSFYRWLEELGFTPSSRSLNGKSIPPIFNVLPVEYRTAFLRGLFSADGGQLNKYGDVCLTVQNDRLRDQVRQLMMGLGIRTLPCKGLKRPLNDRISPGSSSFSYNGKPSLWNIDRPPQQVVERCLGACVTSVDFAGLSKNTRDTIKSALSGRKGCSYQYLRKSMDLCKVVPPEWFDDYSLEPISEIRDLKQDVEMFDVEMFDDEHAFVVEGVVTHNSNTEWKLTAARDVGIRPLLSSFEDFINAEIFPLIDAELAKKAKICLVGLEAQTPEKEGVELQTGGQVHMTFDDILTRVEKKPVGKAWAGDIPLNPVYKGYLDQLCTVGQILEHFCGIEGAAKDPSLAYRRDPFWFQWQELQAQAAQAAQQAQQPPPPQGGGGGGQQQDGQQDQQEQPPQRQNPQDDQTEKQRSQQQEQSQASPGAGAGAEDLGKAIGQAFDLMTKSETNLPPEKRRILDQHKKTVDFLISGFEEDVKKGIKEILDVAEKLGPT
jgi:hypothetical protein